MPPKRTAGARGRGRLPARNVHVAPPPVTADPQVDVDVEVPAEVPVEIPAVVPEIPAAGNAVMKFPLTRCSTVKGTNLKCAV